MSEIERMREMYKRQKAGWDYIDAERRAALPLTDTVAMLPLFNTSFEYSKTLPPRLESGFTAFYAALSRVKK
ncbi:MAG TPA: hypothetical protein VGL56_02815 [Fimbriimonadaceae bacterium]|jgi:hypothetical protein